jgi:hypothetical protein
MAIMQKMFLAILLMASVAIANEEQSLMKIDQCDQTYTSCIETCDAKEAEQADQCIEACDVAYDKCVDSLSSQQ